MARAKHNSLAAVAYAQSLLDLANDQKNAEPIGADLNAIAEIVRQNPSFAEFLGNPSISENERGTLIKKVFGASPPPLMRNFLGVLNMKNAMPLIGEIASAYQDLLDEQMGKIEVDLTTAQKLTGEQLDQARQKVSAALGKTVVLREFVDDSIIGGIVLRVEDKLIDASVKHQLQAMKEQLLSARRM
jgi:F-type H+-transporting ATPase subunit delta